MRLRSRAFCRAVRWVVHMKSAADATGLYGLVTQMVAVPGRRAELIERFAAGWVVTPFKIAYLVCKDADDEDALWITEVWPSVDDNLKIWSRPEVQKAASGIRPLIAQLRQQHEVFPMGPPEVRPRAGDAQAYGLVTEVTARAGCRAEFIAGLLEMKRYIGEDVTYLIAADAKNDDAVWLSEVWASAQAKAEWLEMPQVKDILARVESFGKAVEQLHETVPIKVALRWG